MKQSMSFAGSNPASRTKPKTNKAKTMRKAMIAALLLLGMSSCQRWKQQVGRNFKTTHAREMRITLYSGGVEVRQWEFKGIWNDDNNGSGGYFYTSDGTLTEVNGDIVVEYLD